MGEFRASGSFKRSLDFKPDRIPQNGYRRCFSDVHSSSIPNAFAIQPYIGPAASQYTEPTGGSNTWNPASDPEVKRKRRLASYKAIAIEGKVKSSVRKSFRWLKDKYLDMVYG